MKQTIEIEVPDGKKAVWKDNKVVFEGIKPQLPKTWEEFCEQNPIKNGEYSIDTFSHFPKHKFHVGQYITDGYVGGKITSIEDNYSCYKILDFMGGINTAIPFTLQDNYHLWTIQDAKDGDVLVCDIDKAEIGGDVEKLPNIVPTIFNFKKLINSRDYIHSYCHLYDKRFLGLQRTMYYNSFVYNISPATKEQRDLLFQKIKEAGYKWNNETKTLEKLVEHRFDPKTLQPFDKVLVRDINTYTWRCSLFSHIIKRESFPYMCVCSSYTYCIPYNEDTKHLIGTTDEAPEYYKYWEE